MPQICVFLICYLNFAKFREMSTKHADLDPRKYLDHEFSQTSRLVKLKLHTIISTLTGAHPILTTGSRAMTIYVSRNSTFSRTKIRRITLRRQKSIAWEDGSFHPSLQAILAASRAMREWGAKHFLPMMMGRCKKKLLFFVYGK